MPRGRLNGLTKYAQYHNIAILRQGFMRHPGRKSLLSNAVIKLIYQKCLPDRCNSGICPAVQSCPLGLLQQEERFDYPFAGHNLCKGCASCVSACPYNAIKLV